MWPPHQSPADEAALLHLATDYALSHGLVLRPPIEPGHSEPSQTAVIHAPFSLYPSTFPKHLFEQAKHLQPLYNALYAHATVDDSFLREVVGGAVSKVDEFQGELYRIWEQVKKEGVRQVSWRGRVGGAGGHWRWRYGLGLCRWASLCGADQAGPRRSLSTSDCLGLIT